MKQSKAAIFSILLVLPTSQAFATEQVCNQVVAPTLERTVAARLFVYEAEHQVFELGMTAGEQPHDIKRVTYSAADSACEIRPLALEKGGDWGWHLVWEEDTGVFYARMDGEAWVSSPKKKIAISPVSQIEFNVIGQTLELRWLDEHGNRVSRRSEDEGRFWD